ncbi:MAG: hypothetical protein RL173_2659 [Fibrobacterota bacterium]
MRHLSISLLCASTIFMTQPANAAATKVVDNGPDAGKRIIAVLGDGYGSAQQARFNSDVDNLLVNGVFGHDFFKEEHNAFNVYRVNLVSVDSNVSTRVYNENGTPDNGSDDIIVSTTMKNTPLKYIYSGSWAHCWVEPSATSETLINNALAANVPNAQFVVILLNQNSFGGCAGGNRQVMPRGIDWTVMAHEFGHSVGGLADEYDNASTYTGAPYNKVNCTTNSGSTTVPWKRFVSPTTAMPSTLIAGVDANRTVGAFEGCDYKNRGIFRPVHNCRMRGNTPDYCPVCRTHMKKLLYPAAAQDFSKSITMDFSGDMKDDVVLYNGNDLRLFKVSAYPYTLSLTETYNNQVPAGTGGAVWNIGTSDQYFPADFDNDGKTDLYVFNGSNAVGMLKSTGSGFQCIARYSGTLGSVGSLYSLTNGDKFQVGDFNGDKKADLFVYNATNWGAPYATTFLSTGTAVNLSVIKGTSIGTWTLKPNDQIFLADFDADGRTDLYMVNNQDWAGSKYFGMIKSTGTDLTLVTSYLNTVASYSLLANDKIMVGDFDGDKRADVYVVNTNTYATFLYMLKSTGTGMAYVNSYNNKVGTSFYLSTWPLNPADQYYVSDVNRDGKADLTTFNTAVSASERLGALTSNGTGISGQYATDWVGGWNLGAADKISVSHYDGATGSPTVFIRNNEWFGLLRKNASSFGMDRLYYHWIYTALYDAAPWSDGFP